DQAVGHAAGLLGHPLERLAHELHPDRQRGARALLRLPERPLLIEPDPHGGDEISREAVEPGVPGLVGGAGLACDVAAPEREGAPPRARLMTSDIMSAMR